MGVIIRQGFKASVSNYVGAGLGFISLVFLFPLFFQPEQLGAVRLFTELGTVMASFALIGTQYSINRFFPYFRNAEKNHHGFFFWVLMVPLTGFILLLIAIALSGTQFFLLINPKALQYKQFFAPLLILVFIILYQVVSEVSCANFGRTAVPNLMREVIMRSLIILAGSSFYFGWVSFSTTIWLMVCAYAIALSGNIWFLNKLSKISLKPDFHFLKKNPALKKESVQFSLMLFFSGLASLIYTKMDFFMISAVRENLGEVAIYSIGYFLATFIEIPKRTIMQVATPIIAGLMKEEKFGEVNELNKKNGNNQFIISGLLFFLIWLNIDNMYALMPNGAYYERGKYIIFIIGIGKVLDSIVCGNGPILVNSRFFKLTMINTLLAICTSFIFNYILVRKFGIFGGAVSAVLVVLVINSFNLVTVFLKMRIHPFHINQLKIAAILLIFMLLSFTGRWLSHPVADSALRTLIFTPILVAVVFKMNVSPEFNELLRSKLPFIKK